MLGAVAIVGALLISQLLAAPHYVSRLTLDNRTGYGMLVEVSDGHGHDWLPIGAIGRRGATSVGQVYDIGDVWQFRISAQTVDLGTFRMSRAQLERSNWHVEIPQRAGDALRARGVDPQP